MIEAKKMCRLDALEAPVLFAAGEPVTVAKRLTLEYDEGLQSTTFRLASGAFVTLDRNETEAVRDILSAVVGN